MYEIDETELYYFTVKVQDEYHTVFVGWLGRSLVKAFEVLDGVGSYAHIRLNIGENTSLFNQL